MMVNPQGIRPFIDHPASKSLRLMLFGDPGTGKTSLAASAHLIPQFRPVLFCSAAAGLKSLEGDDRYNDMAVFPLIDKNQDAETVLKKVEYVWELAERGDYRTIIIDTLTEVQHQGLMFLSSQPAGWDKVLRPKKVTLPMYGQSLSQTSSLVRWFRDVDDVHVIMTCHVRRAHLETDGHDYIVPGLTGQQWKQVVAAFDTVMYLYTTAAGSLTKPEMGVKWRFIAQPFENLKTKDRALGLPVSAEFTNRNLQEVIEMGKKGAHILSG